MFANPSRQRQRAVRTLGQRERATVAKVATPKPICESSCQRAGTGMDVAVRALILKALRGVSNTALMDGFFQDRYANFSEYAAAVGELWGDDAAHELRTAVAQAAIYQPTLVSIPTARQRKEMVAEATLLHVPEPDFRLGVSDVRHIVAHPVRTAKRISAICKRHGLPWEFTVDEGFRWVGDQDVQTI
jgi:hypothetical protein